MPCLQTAAGRAPGSSITKEGKLANIRIIDPSTGQPKELPVRGLVTAGLPDGTILVTGNPQAPAAEISVDDAIAKGRLFHIGPDGKVLGDIAPAGIVSSMPVVSNNGKFIAFQSKPADAPEGPGIKYGFTILSVDGKQKVDVATAYFPAAVMDDGSAVVILNVSDMDGQAPVSLVSKDGKTVKQLVEAVSANVIGQSLIYTVNKDKPAIKTMPLPKP